MQHHGSVARIVDTKNRLLLFEAPPGTPPAALRPSKGDSNARAKALEQFDRTDLGFADEATTHHLPLKGGVMSRGAPEPRTGTAAGARVGPRSRAERGRSAGVRITSSRGRESTE